MYMRVTTPYGCMLEKMLGVRDREVFTAIIYLRPDPSIIEKLGK